MNNPSMVHIEKIEELVTKIGRNARRASRHLLALSADEKKRILISMADELDKNRSEIRSENELDVRDAQDRKLGSALTDRLLLTESRLDDMIVGIREVAELSDPVGRILRTWTRDNGLVFNKVAVPIGVIGMIFESRPNVTADAAALCLKSSNVIILRGGSEAHRSNSKIAEHMLHGGKKAGMPDFAIQIIPVRDRQAVRKLITMNEYVDLIIPRGGEGLIKTITEHASVPVLKHFKGVCHIYVDGDSDRDKAFAIVVNAKCQRPGVCNAAETLLVDSRIAGDWLPAMAELFKEKNVEIRGDDESRKIVPWIIPATEKDWSEEYLDLIISVRVVNGIEQAVEHINLYGTGHSDAIVSENARSLEYFSRMVDSATVYLNASTRFTDGAEFGMGAEIGISTDRLHARGPVGLEELTTYKYVIEGNGQIR
jgi:glutamate-5-semialdehyde dehydrogenase